MLMEFRTRGIGRILEAADLDFAVVDMEHSNFDAGDIADLMSWFRGCSFAPLVRIPQNEYHFTARALDAGALGIMAPNVETPEDAERLVRAAKYAPRGNRGVGLGTAHNDYLMPPDPSAYLREANERTTIICQIESPLGVENAERIAAVDGVDCLWVGHFDLSQAMRITGKFQHPEFLAALDAVVRAATKHGKYAGAQPGTADQARQWWTTGFRVLSWRSDIALYRLALQDGMKTLRECEET